MSLINLIKLIAILKSKSNSIDSVWLQCRKDLHFDWKQTKLNYRRILVFVIRLFNRLLLTLITNTEDILFRELIDIERMATRWKSKIKFTLTQSITIYSWQSVRSSQRSRFSFALYPLLHRRYRSLLFSSKILF